MQYVFATVPALVSYNDGEGNTATIHYPVTSPDSGPGGPGTGDAPFLVTAQPSGHVVVTLTFWRPQRKPIPGETGYGTPGAWTDIGGLSYGLGVNDTANGGTVSGPCPQKAYSETDSNLTAIDPAFAAMAGGGFTDLAGDSPASSTNTLTYTVDLTQCLASLGLSFNPGQARVVTLNATACGANGCLNGQSSGPDVASQTFFFERN